MLLKCNTKFQLPTDTKCVLTVKENCKEKNWKLKYCIHIFYYIHVFKWVENIDKFGTFFIELHFLLQFLYFKQMKCQNSSQNKSVQESYFLQGRCPMSVDVVVWVCFLWWETLHLLLVSLCRTAAAAWGCPAVPLVVSLTQWQVSAVPVTVALCSRNHQEAKISDAAQKEAEKKKKKQWVRISAFIHNRTCVHRNIQVNPEALKQEWGVTLPLRQTILWDSIADGRKAKRVQRGKVVND